MRGLGALLILLIIIPKSIQLCTTQCPVHFKTLGCFTDQEVPNRRLPNYILTDRDSSISIYSGKNIDWFNWDGYIRDFACRCAKKATDLGYDLFGLQFYGECWAGHSAQHAPVESDALPLGCVGDGYRKCDKFQRYCVGHQWQNMVYRIIDPGCAVKFQRVGCYGDAQNARGLPKYLYNERDNTITNFGDTTIDWRNWDEYIPAFACRCAKRAFESNHKYFGLQFYGECWSQEAGNEIGLYARHGQKNTCVSNCYSTCKPTDKFCVGDHYTNAVYKIDGPCDIQIEEKGCYKEASSGTRLLPIEIRNEIDPTSSAFAAKMLKPSTWVADFSLFLCNCARTVRERGYRYFGINNIGSCWSGVASDDYASLGNSTHCYNGKEGQSCVAGDQMCAGWNSHTNFVYEIKNPIQSW